MGLLPKISDTERAALECGTVSTDGDIFKGIKPNHTVASFSDLTQEEKEFFDTKVSELIRLHDYYGYQGNDLHPAVWSYLKQEGFFALNIPKEYGGHGFGPLMNSMVVTAISSSGHISLAVTVMVPNSLGPAELLMHYGTEKERLEYLPRLATGAIPCFALTGPRNGSDATGALDVAHEVEPGTYHVSLDKRYITLAPVADLIGLAVNVKGKGITVFLIERDHPGLEIGARHNPLKQPFMNGPIRGTIALKDEQILGGPEMLGKGWNMLVDCLTVGRAISLPGLSVGTSLLAHTGSHVYASKREQFGTNIGRFQGIQEKLADIKYTTELLYATQDAINGELHKGEAPAVLSAMWKYQSTERARKAVNDAMDVMGGNGIQLGPKNFIGETYMSMPIAITVEGANVLTRSLITFGQGLMRSHPHVRNIVEYGNNGDTGKFIKEVLKLGGHAVWNFTKAMVGNKYGLFAFTADMCLTLGAKYKTAERLSSRMADIFSIRYMSALNISEHAKERLYNEEKEAYRVVIKELPLIVRPLMHMLMLINFPITYTFSSKEIKEYASEQFTSRYKLLVSSALRVYINTPETFVGVYDDSSSEQ